MLACSILTLVIWVLLVPPPYSGTCLVWICGAIPSGALATLPSLLGYLFRSSRRSPVTSTLTAVPLAYWIYVQVVAGQFVTACVECAGSAAAQTVLTSS